MKQFLRYILTLVAILIATTNAWAWRGAKAVVISEPTQGGWVYVADNAPSSWSLKEHSQEKEDTWAVRDKNFTFYRHYKCETNFIFKGWSEDKNANTGTTTSSCSISGNLTNYNTKNYYAIFATLQSTAHNTTVQFNDTKVDEQLSKSITIKHSHAETVSLSLSGTNAGDFSLSENSFTSTSYQEGRNITIYFKPTCVGERTATLTISSNNGLSSLTVYLKGNGLRHTPTAITWQEPIDVNMFIGDSRTVNVNSTTDGNITYSSSDAAIVSVSGNTLTAKAEGTVVITATQAETCKYEASSIKKEFYVHNKKTPTFWLNGDPDQLTDNLKTEDTRTITITNVDERMTADYDPNLLSYTFNGSTATIKALDAGTATLKLTQPENNQIFYGDRTFTFYITKYETNTITNDLATNYMVDDVVAEADIYTINNHEVPVEIISGNNNVLKFENGQLKAVGAGTTTLTVKQSATKKWVERTATKTITVHKYDITASINPDNAVWNQLVTPNPFSASTQHKFSGATSAVTDFTVTQQGNEHIALMDANTRNIQTYFNDGTVKFLVRRQEDYKYNELLEELELIVEYDKNGCYAFNDDTKAFDLTKNSKTSQSIQLNGVGNILTFYYKINSGTDWVQYDHHVTTQYSTDGTNFNDISNSRVSTNTKTNTKSHEIQVPQTAKYIRFVWSADGTGGRDIYVSNITVTRAQYIRPTDAGQPLNSTNALVLPPVAINLPRSKQFNLEWSACSDIKITCDNPKFTISTTDISAISGSQNITITCNTSEIGTFIGDVTIYNQEQKETFPVICEVYTKWLTDSISGSATHSMKVDQTWDTDFYFPIQRVSQYPTTDGAFHYAIEHTFIDENPADRNPNNPNEVISYNNGVITAHNAGTAILTIKHDETPEHFESQQFTCTLTVSKHDAELQWKDPVYFNDTVYNYFTTTDTISPIVIESQTDTDVAKLTNEFNPTSNNSLDLITFNKEASTTVTISQVENYKWNGYSTPHTITPIDQNNHVTFTLTQENYIPAFKHSFVDPAANDQSRGPDWQSGGIYFGGEGALEGNEGWNWDEKYFIIQFTGIPDSIYFDASRSGSATGTIKLSVSEGKTPDNLTEVWSNSNNSENNKIIRKLNPDSRYLKFSYTGNLWGLFKNITVTELNQFEAVPDRLDFGQQYVDEPSIPKTFDFKYANAGYKVQLQSNDSHFTVEPTYIDTIGGEKYGTIKDIKVTYHPTEEHNTANTDAKIYILDEAGHKDSVILTASAIKSTPTLSWTSAWSATEPIVLLNQTVTNAAISSNGYPVKYRSYDESIIQIINDGTAFIGKGTGRVEITAYQEPDRVYNAPTEISKTFIVTDKIAQYIVWDDNLTNLRIGDDPITLNAQVWVMTDAASNTWEYSPTQTAKLQYSSPNDAVVSIENNILTINGVGELLIEATIQADETYEYAHAQIPVRVRDNSTTCSDEDLIIPVKKDGTALELTTTLEYNPYLSTSEHIVEIDRTAGIPGELIFGYYGREAWWTLSGKIRVYESSDNGNTWQQVLSDADAVKPKAQELQYSPRIPLSTTATHIKFQRFESTNLGYHVIQYITVLPAKYIQAEDVDWGNIYVGNRPDTTITFNYSSVRSDMVLSTSHANLSVTPTRIIKDCGDWGTESLTITLNANTSIIGEFHEQVFIHDQVGNISETIHVYANIVKNSPTITWTPTDTIRSSAEWETKKTAIASSGDQVLYEITAGNQPNEYAYLNNDGKMILLRGGQITARAYTPATTTSNEMSVFHNFIIVVDPLFEDFANDNNWLNDNNWNIGRTPWATDSATIKANKHVQLTTEVSIDGMQFEAGSSIHITSTGGLTVGAHGIQGAASDGSSIIIDNLKTGAGFLRISPEYKGTMPRITMRYQTKSTLDSGANKDATWQYIGAPGEDASVHVDYNTWLYRLDESQADWVLMPQHNNHTLSPFQGYALTQYGQPTYEWNAQMINHNCTIPLTYHFDGRKGQNLIANSYTAPIDVTQMIPEDFQMIEGQSEYYDITQTIYLYNSGSWNAWHTQDSLGTGISSDGNNTTPGQYYAIPVLAVAEGYIPEKPTIAPMQGIYVRVRAKKTGGDTHVGNIIFDYDRIVMGEGHDMHRPMRAPKKSDITSIQSENFRRLRIVATSEHSGADRLYIIQDDINTRNYDNGYDAPNQATQGIVNIYTYESGGKMEVSCANNIDSTYIGFMAGEDRTYTLHFNAIIGETLCLQDLVSGEKIYIVEDGTYTFEAEPQSTNNQRFLLHAKQATNSDMEEINAAHIWYSNHTLHITNATDNSLLQLYDISGRMIFSTTIHRTPYAVDLTHLTEGVYMARLNNQVYKFVCK